MHDSCLAQLIDAGNPEGAAQMRANHKIDRR